MKILYALALTLLLGCATTKLPQPPAPRPVVTGEIVSFRTLERELRPLMSEEYDPQLILMDELYGAIPEDAMRRIINEGLAAHKFDYQEEGRDCDDAAVEATVIFRHLFRRDTHNVSLAAPIGIVGGALVGNITELGFTSPGFPLYHAMCIARCKGGKWLLIEVESKQVIEFTSTIYEGSFEFFLGVF